VSRETILCVQGEKKSSAERCLRNELKAQREGDSKRKRGWRARTLVSPFFRILASFSVTCPRVCFAVSFEGHSASYLVAFVFQIFLFFPSGLTAYSCFIIALLQPIMPLAMNVSCANHIILGTSFLHYY
jgi:hypothetical protein